MNKDKAPDTRTGKGMDTALLSLSHQWMSAEGMLHKHRHKDNAAAYNKTSMGKHNQVMLSVVRRAAELEENGSHNDVSKHRQAQVRTCMPRASKQHKEGKPLSYRLQMG